MGICSRFDDTTDNCLVAQLLKIDRKELDPVQVKKINKLIRRSIENGNVQRVDSGNNGIFNLALDHYQRSGTKSDLKVVKTLCDYLKPSNLTDLTLGVVFRYTQCTYKPKPTVPQARWQRIAEKLGYPKTSGLSYEMLPSLLRRIQQELKDATAAAEEAGKPLLFLIGEHHTGPMSWLSEQAALEIAPNLGIKQLLVELHEPALRHYLNKGRLNAFVWQTTDWILPTAQTRGMSTVGIDVYHSLTDEPDKKKSIRKRNKGMANAINGEIKVGVAKIEGSVLTPDVGVELVPSIAVVGDHHIKALKKLTKSNRFYLHVWSCFPGGKVVDHLLFPELLFPEHMRNAYNALTPQQRGVRVPSRPTACPRALLAPLDR